MGDPLLFEVDPGVPWHWRKKSRGRESLAATVLLYSAGSFFPWWMCSLWGLGRGGVIKVMRPKCSFSKDVDDVIFKNARDLFRNPLVETCGRPALQKSPTLTERFILNDAPKKSRLMMTLTLGYDSANVFPWKGSTSQPPKENPTIMVIWVNAGFMLEKSNY